MIETDDLARAAYEAYTETAISEETPIKWDDLPANDKEGWRAAVLAVVTKL